MMALWCALLPLLGGCGDYIENAPAIPALVTQPARFDRAKVTVVGRVTHLRRKIAYFSHNAYEVFLLCEGTSCVHVYLSDANSQAREGDLTRVRGAYYVSFHTGKYVYGNEIEAEEITPLK